MTYFRWGGWIYNHSFQTSSGFYNLHIPNIAKSSSLFDWVIQNVRSTYFVETRSNTWFFFRPTRAVVFCSTNSSSIVAELITAAGNCRVEMSLQIAVPRHTNYRRPESQLQSARLYGNQLVTAADSCFFSPKYCDQSACMSVYSTEWVSAWICIARNR